MKFCIHCGDRLVDEAQFCSRCGVATGTGDFVPEDLQIEVPTLSDEKNSVRAYLKNFCCSGRAMLIAILMSLSVATSVAFVLQAFFLEYTFMRALNIGIRVGAFVLLLPTFAMLVGVWMSVVTARKSGDFCNMAGLRVICGVSKVMRVFYPVVIALLAVVMLISLLMGMPGASIDSNKIMGLCIDILILIIICVGFALFSVIYYNNMIRTFSSIISAVDTDASDAYISRFLIVMCFVGAGLAASSALGNGLVNFVFSGVTGAYMLLSGLMLNGLRKSFGCNKHS